MTAALSVKDREGNMKARAEAQSNGETVLAWEGEYEPGDQIICTFPEKEKFYVVRIDDTMDEALVFVTKEEVVFDIPFEEKKTSYNPKAFTGERHYLTLRPAKTFEISAYRNLAKNVMDQHGDPGCYPHASANVETRGESVFAAKNAIDGVTANDSHGIWPYQSWGINRRDDAVIRLDFGRTVETDRIILYTRADFPHDNWWTEATFTFSDGSTMKVNMEKSALPHEFTFEKKKISWLEMSNMIKADDPSPFPALSQLEVYGTDL